MLVLLQSITFTYTTGTVSLEQREISLKEEELSPCGLASLGLYHHLCSMDSVTMGSKYPSAYCHPSAEAEEQPVGIL